MCRVRVFINAAKECSRCVFADLLRQQMAASGMLVEERSDVVDETGYEDQGSSLRLFLDWRCTMVSNINAQMRRPAEGEDETHNSDMR